MEPAGGWVWGGVWQECQWREETIGRQKYKRNDVTRVKECGMGFSKPQLTANLDLSLSLSL